MIEVIVFWIIASAIAIGILVYPSMVKFRRDRLMAKPFPSYWLTIVEQNLAIYPKLSLIQQKQLQGNIPGSKLVCVQEMYPYLFH